MDDDDLSRLLNEAKARAPLPGGDLMDRILVDALAHQPAAPTAPPMVRAAPRLWDRFATAFGGVPTLAGLGSAAVLGLVVGYADPTAVDFLTGGLSLGQVETVDLFPTTDFLATEG